MLFIRSRGTIDGPVPNHGTWQKHRGLNPPIRRHRHAVCQTIKRFGWSATFVDFDDLDAVKAAINDDTQAIFCEAIANPGGYITDLDAVAAVADDAVCH